MPSILPPPVDEKTRRIEQATPPINVVRSFSPEILALFLDRMRLNGANVGAELHITFCDDDVIGELAHPQLSIPSTTAVAFASTHAISNRSLHSLFGLRRHSRFRFDSC
jgi:hypothetical protein